MALAPIAVVSWGLLEGAGNKIENTAASWGLMGSLNAPTPSVGVKGILGSLFRRFIGRR